MAKCSNMPPIATVRHMLYTVCHSTQRTNECLNIPPFAIICHRAPYTFTPIATPSQEWQTVPILHLPPNDTNRHSSLRVANRWQNVPILHFPPNDTLCHRFYSNPFFHRLPPTAIKIASFQYSTDCHCFAMANRW